MNNQHDRFDDDLLSDIRKAVESAWPIPPRTSWVVAAACFGRQSLKELQGFASRQDWWLADNTVRQYVQTVLEAMDVHSRAEMREAAEAVILADHHRRVVQCPMCGRPTTATLAERYRIARLGEVFECPGCRERQNPPEDDVHSALLDLTEAIASVSAVPQMRGVVVDVGAVARHVDYNVLAHHDDIIGDGVAHAVRGFREITTATRAERHALRDALVSLRCELHGSERIVRDLLDMHFRYPNAEHHEWTTVANCQRVTAHPMIYPFAENIMERFRLERAWKDQREDGGAGEMAARSPDIIVQAGRVGAFSHPATALAADIITMPGDAARRSASWRDWARKSDFFVYADGALIHEVLQLPRLERIGVKAFRMMSYGQHGHLHIRTMPWDAYRAHRDLRLLLDELGSQRDETERRSVAWSVTDRFDPTTIADAVGYFPVRTDDRPYAVQLDHLFDRNSIDAYFWNEFFGILGHDESAPLNGEDLASALAALFFPDVLADTAQLAKTLSAARCLNRQK